ncbi:hypothetical protein OIP13_00020 [Citrobacter freundii]|nr:hypothetical protein [Citrobacter freundii]
MVVIFVHIFSRLLLKLWELYDQPDGDDYGTETGYAEHMGLMSCYVTRQ